MLAIDGLFLKTCMCACSVSSSELQATEIMVCHGGGQTASVQIVSAHYDGGSRQDSNIQSAAIQNVREEKQHLLA